MNKIEQMHLDAINNCKNEVAFNIFGTMISKVDESLAATETSKVTGQIAVEFVQWYENRDKSIDENMLTWEDYYKEFLKTKQ